MPLNLRALFYLLFFMIFQAMLLGQNQFGRIFIENVNPLLITEDKQDTIVKQEVISKKMIIDEQIIDTVSADTKIKPIKSLEINISSVDSSDIIKPIVSSDNAAIIKEKKNKTIKLRTVLPLDSVVVDKSLFYTIDKSQKYNGRIIDKWENGNNKIDIRIKDGLKHGSSKEWFASGQKMKTNIWKNGVLHGYSREWYDNTQVKSKGKYLFGRKHETWFEYFPNGQTAKKISYNDGVPNGLITTWYSNGQKQEKGSVIKQSVENNLLLYKKIGTWTRWHLNGQKKEKGAYINGQKNGIWVEWYENGEKKSEGQYVENKKQDIWTYWYDDGNKKTKGGYDNGQLNGQWVRWYEWIWRNAASYTEKDNKTLSLIHI